MCERGRDSDTSMDGQGGPAVVDGRLADCTRLLIEHFSKTVRLARVPPSAGLDRARERPGAGNGRRERERERGKTRTLFVERSEFVSSMNFDRSV